MEQVAGAPEVAHLRIDQLQDEVRQAVQNGVETDDYELKLDMDLGDSSTELKFVKLVQGIANNHRSRETLIIIGADQKTKQLLAVPDDRNFDPAVVMQLLQRFLAPTPAVAVYDRMNLAGGGRYVVISIGPEQDRPIVSIREKDAPNERIQKGSILIKRGTALQPATRADLDLMYREKSEQNAERRARYRFAELREELRGININSAGKPSIGRELFALPRITQRSQSNGWIKEEHSWELNLSIESARDVLLLGEWKTPNFPPEGDLTQANSTLQDEERLAVEYLLDLAFQTIKYSGPVRIIEIVCDLLQEYFELYGAKRHAGYDPVFLISPDCTAVRTVMRIWCGLRGLACYAVERKRLKYLPAIQRRFVAVIREYGGASSKERPMLFWPFELSREPRCVSGLIDFCWATENDLFKDYFKNHESFRASALFYDLLLDLNSYAAQNLEPLSKEISMAPNLSVYFVPSILSYRTDQIESALFSLRDALLGSEGSFLFIRSSWFNLLGSRMTTKEVFESFIAYVIEDYKKLRRNVGGISTTFSEKLKSIVPKGKP